MANNTYRSNRAEFYEKILEFEFSIQDLSTFLQDWEDIIKAHPDDSYSPYLELNDLNFLYSVTNGDGKIAIEYLNTIVFYGDIICEESWDKFQNEQYYID